MKECDREFRHFNAGCGRITCYGDPYSVLALQELLRVSVKILKVRAACEKSRTHIISVRVVASLAGTKTLGLLGLQA